MCLDGVCAEPSCNDGMRNVGETDIDCGGGTCRPCGRAARCMRAEDCAGRVCTRGLCALPTCFDSVSNAGETDVDCGGLGCAACADGSACARDSDCLSERCDEGHCASCMDAVQSGGETDADCGGPLCPACTHGAGCALPLDCASGVCGPDLRCAPPRCDDGALNGDESDADCGGGCAPCADASPCTTGADCVGGACVGGWCQGGPALVWEKNLLPAGAPPPADGSASFVTVRAIAASPDGGLAVVADFNARAQLDLDDSIDAVYGVEWGYATIVASFAADGSRRWARMLGSEYQGLQEDKCIAVGSDGTVYVGGRVQLASGSLRFAVDLGGGPRTYPRGDILLFVSAFAADGAHRWLQTHDARKLAAIALRDGEVAIGGSGEAGGFARAYAALDGSLRWSRSIGEDVQAMAFDAAGELHAGIRVRPEETLDLGGGVRVRMRSYYNIALLRIGPDGATRGMSASLQSEGDGSSGPQSAWLAASSGRLHLVGWTSGAVDFGGGVLGAVNDDAFVVVLGTDRSHVWSRLFGSALGDEATSAALAGDGGMVIGGFFRGTVDFGGGPVVGGAPDFAQPAGFVASYGPRGEHRWSRVQTALSSDYDHTGTLVALAPDGAVYAAFGSRIQRLAP